MKLRKSRLVWPNDVILLEGRDDRVEESGELKVVMVGLTVMLVQETKS